MDALVGQTVDVLNGAEVMYSGVAQGVDNNACLQVMTEDGLKQVIYGDVSVRATEAQSVEEVRDV